MSKQIHDFAIFSASRFCMSSNSIPIRVGKGNRIDDTVI